MDIVTQILGTVDEMAGRFEIEDPVLLTSDERASAHRLLRSRDGRSVRVSLPRQAELYDGDVLAIESNVAVVVRSAPEELLVISPKDQLSWGVTGFQLGNLHRPVRFTEKAMLTPADPTVADVLTRLGIAFEWRTLPFVGNRYGAHGDHGHGDDDHGHGSHSHGDHAHHHGH
jgi:urease accessory protein